MLCKVKNEGSAGVGSQRTSCCATSQRFPLSMASGVARSLAAAAMALALMGACLLGATGCVAPTPEDAIRSSLSQKLDGIKGLDDGFLSELQDDLDVDRFSEYGIDGTEFMRSYFDGFDYSIDDIVVDGDTATATVTLQCRSFSQYRDRLTEAAENLVGDREKLASMSNDEVNAAYGALITETLEGVENAPTAAFTITYKLDEDTSTWEPTNAVEYEISSAILTN